MNLSYIDEPLGEIRLKPWHLAAGVVALGGIGALAYYLYKKSQGPGAFVTGQGNPGATMMPGAATNNQCVKIGVQSEPIFDETDELVKTIRAAQAQGKKIFKVPTGNVAVTGTRSRFEEVTIWACPPGQKPPIPKKTMSGDDEEEELSLLDRTRRRNS